MPVRFVQHTSLMFTVFQSVQEEMGNTVDLPNFPEFYVYDLYSHEWILQSLISPRPTSPKSVIN